MSARIFLSYRRDDSAGYAGRVQDRLVREFGRDVLFMDVDAIPLGVNFATFLNNEVAKCEVLLAVIGPNWLDARNEAGTRRLDDPHDFVRIEIGAALQRNIAVIPILLDGAKVPKANQLPKDLDELSLRNGLDVRHASFHNDIDKLVRGLKVQLAEANAKERRREEEEEQKPLQPVSPRRLPLIGAVVSTLPMVALVGILRNSSVPSDVKDAQMLFALSIIPALYGGAAGMLVARFGYPRAVVTPAIPAFLLGFVFLGFWYSWDTVVIGITAMLFAPAFFFTWLAFRLHAKWARKRRMIDSGLVQP